MTANIFTEFAKKTAIDALTGKQNDLFYEEDGLTYMRYDKISIAGIDGEIQARFYWKGDCVYILNVECDFSKSNIIDLCGVRGSIECKTNPILVDR